MDLGVVGRFGDRGSEGRDIDIGVEVGDRGVGRWL